MRLVTCVRPSLPSNPWRSCVLVCVAQVPSTFSFLGIRNETAGSVHGLHTPRFIMDEAQMPLGAQITHIYCVCRSAMVTASQKRPLLTLTGMLVSVSCQRHDVCGRRCGAARLCCVCSVETGGGEHNQSHRAVRRTV